MRKHKNVLLLLWHYIVNLYLFVGGQICITNAVERQWYNLLNTLICDHHCDPQYLNLESCNTPIHSALFLGLHKDPGKNISYTIHI